MNEKALDFIIPEWALIAIYNGDWEELEPEEQRQLIKFLAQLPNGYFATWTSVGFLKENDISNLGDICYQVTFLADEPIEIDSESTNRVLIQA